VPKEEGAVAFCANKLFVVALKAGLVGDVTPPKGAIEAAG